MFNIAGCPACCGGGLGAPYRIGATLVNLDIPGMPAGPKYFSRAGKGTWIGVLRDLNGKNIGPFVDKPSREHGDITSDVWPSVFYDKMKDGLRAGVHRLYRPFGGGNAVPLLGLYLRG